VVEGVLKLHRRKEGGWRASEGEGCDDVNEETRKEVGIVVLFISPFFFLG
jgi:hypothetical protein